MPTLAGAGALVPRLLDLIFPPRCVACGAPGAPLCAACAATIRPPQAQPCARCGQPLGPDADPGGGGAPRGLCARCAATGGAGLDGLRVAAVYEGAVRQALWALKYHGQRRLAKPLGDLLARAGAGPASRAALVVPVPLHPERERRRGYNQSALLARRCATRLGLPLRADLLARMRATPPQVGLDAAARRANVAGAFAVVGGGGRRALEGRVVLLVDDVCTSGSTLAEAAGALLAGGAGAVWGLAVARPAIGAEAAPPRASGRGERRAGGR